jgi:hypothetical protein
MVNLFPGVPAECLCSTHLNSVLAESINLLLPSMRKKNSIYRYMLHGCVDLPYIYPRICECLAEATLRGKAWKYKNPTKEDQKIIEEYFKTAIVDLGKEFFGDERRKEMTKMNMMVLSFRCPECRKRIEELHKH